MNTDQNRFGQSARIRLNLRREEFQMQNQKGTIVKIVVVLMVVMLSAGGAFAKGKGKLTRIEGTVKSIGKDSVTVETDVKQTVNLKITSATKFLKDKKASTFSTMKTGDHVVFKATPSADSDVKAANT